MRDRFVIHQAPLPRLLDDLPAQRLLKVAGSSDLRRELSKVTIDLPGMTFPIRKGCAYLFVVSTGSGDHYGENENADFYNESEGLEVDIPRPFDGRTHKLVLGPGLKERHRTFLQHGAVYRHHRTEPEHGVPRSGEIVWERYNEPMHRGELIVELPEDKWATELAQYDDGIPLMWSQGNGVPADYCSVCAYKFTPKSKSRCAHITFQKLCFDQDGRPISILCPNPLFYDISHVGNNPAAKIAAALLRVASSESEPVGPRAAESLRIRNPFLRSPGAVLRQLVQAEPQQQRCTVRTAVRKQADSEPAAIAVPSPEAEAAFIRKAASLGPRRALDACTQLNVVLTPTQWARIFGPGELMGVSGFLGALPGVFKRAAADPAFLDDASWHPGPADPSAVELLRSPAAELAKPSGFLLRRASSSPADPAGHRLALEYARYLVCALSSVRNSGDPNRHAVATTMGC